MKSFIPCASFCVFCAACSYIKAQYNSSNDPSAAAYTNMMRQQAEQNARQQAQQQIERQQEQQRAYQESYNRSQRDYQNQQQQLYQSQQRANEQAQSWNHQPPGGNSSFWSVSQSAGQDSLDGTNAAAESTLPGGLDAKTSARSKSSVRFWILLILFSGYVVGFTIVSRRKEGIKGFPWTASTRRERVQ